MIIRILCIISFFNNLVHFAKLLLPLLEVCHDGFLVLVDFLEMLLRICVRYRYFRARFSKRMFLRKHPQSAFGELDIKV